jgi:hypothetical protein
MRAPISLLVLGLFPALARSPARANDVLYEIVVPTTQSFGAPLCRLRDITGDDRPDFAAVLHLGYSGAEVRIFSGADGSLVRTIADPDPQFGRSLAAAGDVDGDRFEDLIVGASTFARVYSGRDGRLLFEFQQPGLGDNYSSSVAGVGDVNGDGHPDIVVGAAQEIVIGGGDHYTIFYAGPGYAEVRSGADGSLLRVLHAVGSSAAFGGQVCAAGDVDGDGVGDIAVSSFLQPFVYGTMVLTLFSGATGTALWEIPLAGSIGMGGVIAPLARISHDM